MPKEKLTLYLEPEHIEWLESQTDEEQKASAVVRNLIRKAMKLKSKRKSTVSDPFSYYIINPDVIPDDLKEYADLLIEWWPIRKKKGASCTQSVANRIFDTLRSFRSQDSKQALEKAIRGGCKYLFPIKESKFTEEPKNNHPASRVFTAKGGFQ